MGRDRERHGATELDTERVEAARRGAAVEGVDLQRLFTAGVRDGHDALAVGQPGGEPIAHALALAGLQHGALPVARREHPAAGGDEGGVALGMDVGGLEVAAGGDEAPASLRAVRVELHRHALGLARRPAGHHVQRVEIATAVIDDRLAVGRRVADVEAVVVGVLLQVRAAHGAGVEVADAVVIAAEVDAVADPQRSDELATQLRLEATPLAPAGGVDPEHAGSPAAIALPAGGVVCVARQDAPAAAGGVGCRGLGHEVGRAQVEGDGLAAAGGDLAQAVDLLERVARVGGVADTQAVGAPAGHDGVVGVPGQTARLAALGRHHVDVGGALVGPDEGDLLAVGRQARVAAQAAAAGQAAGNAAAKADLPEIVVGAEDDPTAVHGRKAVVALLAPRGARLSGHRARRRRRAAG